MVPDLRGRGVLFDKDGTLFDFTASWAAASEDILRRLADGDAQRLRAMATAGGFDIEARAFRPDSIIIAGTTAEIHGTLARAGDLPIAHVRAVTDRVIARAEMVPVDGVDAVLAALRRAGAKLGVVTNDSEAAAKTHLEATGLLAHFHTVVGFDSGFDPKPAPGSCLGAAGRMGIAAGDCVMVGDSTHDLEAGAAAGMISFGVLTGIADTAALAPLARAVLPSVADLPPWLAEMTG